eukprot:gene20272-22258_t
MLPNIMKFKAKSFLFDHTYSELYSTSSSSTILTGLPAIDTGMIRGKILPFTKIPSVASTGGLQYQHITIAESIRNIYSQLDEIPNYLTAFIGYWKLGHGKGGMYLPHQRGFDFWTGVAFSHSQSCTGGEKSSESKWRNGRHFGQYYSDVVYNFLPWLIGVLISICSAYYFKVISSKEILNSLPFCFVSLFVFFAFLEIYRIQKSASCLLYHMNEIAEQPYHMENLTLFFTSSVMALLDYFSEKSQPFFVNLDYLKLSEPHFSSKYFNNSLQELDWSIGKIMAKFDELGLTDKTLLILTGNKHCDLSSENLVMRYAGYESRDLKSLVHTSDVVHECMKVPLYLKQSRFKTKSNRSSIPISFLDITPTILELMTNMTQDDYPGCNIIPLLTTSTDREENNISLPLIYDLKQAGIVDESMHNKHRCNYMNRMQFHYVDITKTPSITIGTSLRMIFSNVDGDGNVQMLKYPILRSLEKKLNLINTTSDYMEELFQNVSTAMKSHQRNRKNKWSSQFEMPVYPWIMPCANFPKCEAFNQVLSDFSFLDPAPGLIEPKFKKGD